MSLDKKHCRDCRLATRSLDTEAAQELLAELKGWTIVNNHHLSKSFKCKDFMKALAIANQVGEIAEEEGHHPDLLVRWGELKIDIFTHKVDGLTESDFILAAKIDQIKEIKIKK